MRFRALHQASTDELIVDDSLEGISDNATALIVLDDGRFKVVARAGDDGDITITGGQSFVIIAREAGVAEVIGHAWENVSD